MKLSLVISCKMPGISIGNKHKLDITLTNNFLQIEELFVLVKIRKFGNHETVLDIYNIFLTTTSRVGYFLKL